MGAAQSGSVLLQGYDRFVDARELDLATLRHQQMERPEGYGWAAGEFAVRMGRIHALFRYEGELHYLCGRQIWNVDGARVRRRVVWPVRILTFRDGQRRIFRRAWPDWEIARRWFIPSDGGLDVDDFDWSKLIQSAFAEPGRRDRIFPAPTSTD